MVNERRTCLVYHIDEGLCVVPKEVMNCVALMLAREDRLNQGGSERPPESDQTSVGWGIGVDKNQGADRAGEGGTEDVRVIPWGPSGAKWGACSRSPSRDEPCALRVPSISWISSLHSSTLVWLYPTCGALLRLCSISCMALGLLGKGTRWAELRLITTPFQILECNPHGFFVVIRILSLDYGHQHLAHVETVFRQFHGILVVNHFVLVGPQT